MDHSTFVRLLRSTITDHDGHVLIEQAEKEGTPELVEWLRMYGEKWSIEEFGHMRPVMFLAQHPIVVVKIWRGTSIW